MRSSGARYGEWDAGGPARRTAESDYDGQADVQPPGEPENRRKNNPPQQLAEVVPGGAQNRIDPVACSTVRVETPFSFTVAIPPPQLPGDYNQNGEVDAADYIVWRKTLGSDVPTYASADGDGNGHIGPEDYDIWRAHFGETLPMAGAGSADVAAGKQSQGFVFISTARLPQSGGQITLLATPTMLATGMQQAPAKDSEMLATNMLSDSGEFTSTAYEMALAAKNPGPRASDSPFGKSRHSVYTAPRANQIIDAALMVWPSQRWQRMPADLDLTNGAVGNASSSASLHSQSLDIAISDLNYGMCTLIKSLS